MINNTVDNVSADINFGPSAVDRWPRLGLTRERVVDINELFDSFVSNDEDEIRGELIDN